MENHLGYFFFETPDVEKARAFYAALFGWTFDRRLVQADLCACPGGRR
jgi:predicted enzyme related to lactoylglutathione lyase